MPGICKLLVPTLILVSLPWLVKTRNEPNPCELDMDPGPCRALQPKFYHNTTTGTCECFDYGGCKGNDNKFSELLHCMSLCNVDPAKQKTKDCKKLSSKPKKITVAR
ncbi:unnamed protein product [Meganyctiphanes norvegica]|uniref:BPTI/Kunitz inhibitor domain-containing protein n=1 Tax=Meganyctiphanes norvegica TaxID=48144 RepID=A0AAV2S6Z7_MEGNR